MQVGRRQGLRLALAAMTRHFLHGAGGGLTEVQKNPPIFSLQDEEDGGIVCYITDQASACSVVYPGSLVPSCRVRCVKAAWKYPSRPSAGSVTALFF